MSITCTATQTWRNGRELSTLTKGGKKTSYEYDVDGLRNLKTNADGSYSVYYWLGNLLLAEQRFASATATTPTWTMVFSYDENSTPIGYQLKGTSGVWYYYYYAKNIQGDIVALYRYDKDADGNKVATHIANYEYDPWGKVLSITNASGADLSGYSSNAAVLNPLRYRGYYYDTESGFCYLQSRYYDPCIGRFINADAYASTGQNFLGYNMFVYCNNNPIRCKDSSGNRTEDSIWSLEHDDQGIYILMHWLYGGGEECNFVDGEWGTYMRNNQSLHNFVIKVVSDQTSNMIPGTVTQINVVTSAEIENGESIIGYQYLHGTNADVGGFVINGTVGKDISGNMIYDIYCTWNDMIDPNFQYGSDRAKARLAHWIPFANPTNYKISISWRMTNSSYGGRGGKIRNVNIRTAY